MGKKVLLMGLMCVLLLGLFMIPASFGETWYISETRYNTTKTASGIIDNFEVAFNYRTSIPIIPDRSTMFDSTNQPAMFDFPDQPAMFDFPNQPAMFDFPDQPAMSNRFGSQSLSP